MLNKIINYVKSSQKTPDSGCFWYLEFLEATLKDYFRFVFCIAQYWLPLSTVPPPCPW